MVWFDKLKLNKQLVRAVNEAGYASPKEIQLKTLTRIVGGQDIIAIGPEGCGKTTTYVLGVLNRFNYAPEGVPRVLVLVPGKDEVMAVAEQFEQLNKNKSISIVTLYVAPGIEAQMDALADGADIVIATPDRARAIYLKLGLNLNKVDLFVVDDADMMVKKGLQLPVTELANSITKCQHLVFAEVMHARLDKMIAPFMKQPAIIEVEELNGTPLETYQQLLYNVPDFGTKLNLLNLFLHDEELFTKTVVFVNNSVTAEKLYQGIGRRLHSAAAYLNPQFFDLKGYKSVEDFKADPGARVLIVINENNEQADFSEIPFLIHFDLPAEKEMFLTRIINHTPGSHNETLAITLATDLELSMVKKIEQAIGKKIPAAQLPDNLVIEKEARQKKAEAKPAKAKPEAPAAGAAFHEKKPENSKTYNYSSGTKAKMSKKKKHG